MLSGCGPRSQNGTIWFITLSYKPKITHTHHMNHKTKIKIRTSKNWISLTRPLHLDSSLGRELSLSRTIVTIKRIIRSTKIVEK